MPAHTLPLMPLASVNNEHALRTLAGRAIHRPTDLGMREVVCARNGGHRPSRDTRTHHSYYFIRK